MYILQFKDLLLGYEFVDPGLSMEFPWLAEHEPSFFSSERHRVVKFPRFRNDSFQVTAVDSDPFQILVISSHLCRRAALATKQQYTANSQNL